MVRRRYTVRFRRGLPVSDGIFEISAGPVCRVRGTSRGDAPTPRMLRMPAGDEDWSLSVFGVHRITWAIAGTGGCRIRVLLVQTRMSAIGWVVGASETVMRALLEALGPA